MVKRKLNVAILSDSPTLVTGYATISREIANYIAAEGHNVYYLASNYIGQNLEPGVTFEDGKKLNFKILGQGREGYFKDLLPIYMKQYKIDVFLVLLDTFMVYPWFMQLDLSPSKVIFYYPSDGGGHLPLGCENVLKFCNKAIAMAKFGQKQVKEVHGFETGYIPHATFPDVYKPLSKEEKSKFRQMFSIPDNKFVIGTVARNQGRKMLDRTIKIFAEYAKKDPDALLFMHTDPDDQAQVFHMGSLLQRYNIMNRVLFSGMRYYKGFDYAQMNAVYNIMDVFILSTSGEGFGIPIIEAMSAGVPVLATDYTTTPELVTDHNAGFGIKLLGEITGSWNVERGLCDIEDGVKKLEMLKASQQLRETMGKNGRDAVLKEYDWKIVGPQWVKLVEELGGAY